MRILFGGALLVLLVGTAQAAAVLPVAASGSVGCTPASGPVCDDAALPAVGGIQGLKFFLDQPYLFPGNSAALAFSVTGTVGGTTSIAAGTGMSVGWDFTINSSPLVSGTMEFSILATNFDYLVDAPVHGGHNTGIATSTFLHDLNPGDTVTVEWQLNVAVTSSTGVHVTIPSSSIDFGVETPEPASFLLLASVAGAVGARRRMRTAQA